MSFHTAEAKHILTQAETVANHGVCSYYLYYGYLCTCGMVDDVM